MIVSTRAVAAALTGGPVFQAELKRRQAEVDEQRKPLRVAEGDPGADLVRQTMRRSVMGGGNKLEANGYLNVNINNAGRHGSASVDVRVTCSAR